MYKLEYDDDGCLMMVKIEEVCLFSPKSIDGMIARLEDDLAKRYDVLVDGIAVDSRPGSPVITADAKDRNFHAAIFGNDDDAMPDMTTDELEQARRYIIHGEGAIPIRRWRERKLDPQILVGDRHEELDFPPLPPAA